MKKKKKRSLSRKLIALICFCAAVVLAAWLLGRVFIVRSVMVVGNRNVSTERIVELSGVKRGTNFFRISRSELAKNVERELFIEFEGVDFDYKGRLTIYVKERVGLALISEGGRLYVIDENGMVLRMTAADEATEEDFKGMPQVVGLVPRMAYHSDISVGMIWPAEKPERLTVLKKLLGALNTIGLLTRTSKINLEDLTNLYFMTEDDMKVELGSINEIELKLLIAMEVLGRKELPEDRTGMTIDVGNSRNAHLIPAVHATRTPQPTATPAPTATPKPTREPKKK